MDGELVIECKKSDAKLTIKKVDEHHAVISFEGAGFSVRTMSWEHRWNDLVQYFRDLSENKDGWSGNKDWENIEGEFSISATSDNLGNVTFEIVVRERADSWKFVHSIEIDSGLLENYYKKLNVFFGGTSVGV